MQPQPDKNIGSALISKFAYLFEFIFLYEPLRMKINHLSTTLGKNKNSAEVDIAPAFGEITTVSNVGQAKNGSWCLP